MDVLQTIRQAAIKQSKVVVLPEGEDERILQACSVLLDQGIAKPILLGNQDLIDQKANQLGLDIKNARIIDTASFNDFDHLYDRLKSIYQAKGKTLSEAVLLEQFNNPLYFGALLLKSNEAHCCVAGISNTTANVLRAGFSILGTKPNISTISGAFIMLMPDNRIFIFADCAAVVEPTAQQLADIALSSANTAKVLLNLEPKVAMLSFSTQASAKHKNSDKVAEATKIAKKKAPSLIIEGEIQLDAAIVPSVAKIKMRNSVLLGEANVLVFPNLDAANIGYKLVQRLANAQAIGPILQGINQPMNDLSRGALVEDIVNTVAISVIQSTNIE